jgi:hypothetical protein
LRAPFQFGLSSAPTLFFFPAAEGDHAASKLEPFNYDLNRKCVWQRLRHGRG